MADQLVTFTDYAKVRKGLQLIGTGLNKELDKGLKGVAKKVVTKAQAEAERKGLRASGELIRKITPSVTQKGVAVVARAKREGFSYPAVYEYGGRGKVNATGPRAFLRPGLQKAGPQIAQELQDVIKSTVSKAGFK
jgi:phage gpG-like protein